MAYHKVPEQVRACAFCGTAFTAAHRRRIYCSNSCNTRACVARNAAKAGVATSGLARPGRVPASPTTAPAPVTLAHNLQNWAMLTIAPQVPTLVGAFVHLVGELLAPRGAGPSTWLPAALQQAKGPLVAIAHASWEEPRFFVELAYGDHMLYYRAQHELLVVREATGSLRQLGTEAEFAALPTPGLGIASLLAKYTPSTSTTALLPPAEPAS